VRVHDLRRTLGSWLAAQGHNLSLIGKTLGHTNVNTTAIYARLDIDPVRIALEANAALMLGVSATPAAVPTK
jgi:integrase